MAINSHFDPNQETIEAPSPLLLSGSTERLRQAARRLVNVVDGSAGHMSTETRDVLRVRLLAVSVLFFAGFSAFLIRWLLVSDDGDGGWLFAVHCFVTLIMGLMAVVLQRSKEISLTKLRIAELIVFADPALYFLVLTQQKLQHSANLADGAHLPIILRAVDDANLYLRDVHSKQLAPRRLCVGANGHCADGGGVRARLELSRV